MDELVAGDQKGVSRAWSGHAAPYLLSEECSEIEHHVVAAVVPSHARGTGGFFVVAAARGGRLRVTPCSTQQRGALRNCQCQDDGKDNCSKHAMLRA